MGNQKDGQTAKENDPVVTAEELEKMRSMSIQDVDIQKLSDIREVKIEEHLNQEEKRKEFIRQIGNPYLYRHGEYVVKLSYADTKATLADRMKGYLERMAEARL